MRKACTTLVLFTLFIVLLPMKAMADGKPWHWVAIISGVDKWYVYEGEGNITFNGKYFDAKLFDSTDKSLSFTITGEVNAEKVNAHVITHDSDIGERRMVGTYNKATWKNFSTAGRETMLVSDKTSMFGLTRETDK